MGFHEIANRIQYPQGTSPRYERLDALERMLNGRFYKHLPYSFEDEHNGRDNIRLKDRRPSIQFNAATIIVDQLCGLLWGDEQPPRIVMREEDDEGQDDTQERSIAKLRQRLHLDTFMAKVFRRGNVGSVAIVVRAKKDGSPLLRVIAGKNALPIFDNNDPTLLTGLVQIYPVEPRILINKGYSEDEIDTNEKFYWIRIEYDAREERRYKPLSDTDYQRLGQVVNGRTITWVLEKEYLHDFGVINAIWVRNLDEENEDEDDPDGPCTFGQVVDNIVALDYQLSQIDRGYKYTADPMLAINQGELVNASLSPVGEKAAILDNDGNIVKTPKNVINLGTGGSAEMIEITGQGLAGSTEFAKMMREWMLEVMSANKADSEHTKGVMSGRALDILHRALRLLKNRQRVAYGDNGLVPLVKLILIGMERGELTVPGIDLVPSDSMMWLDWPTEDLPDETGLLSLAQAAETFAGGSANAPVATMPIERIARLICSRLSETNVTEYIKQLESQNKQRQADMQQSADADADRQIKVAAAKPNPARSGKDK